MTIIERVRALAKLHGWAIGEHGSMARDIDLIAVPWGSDASPLDVLVAALEQVLKLSRFGGMSEKPFGRRGWLFRQEGSRMVGSIERPSDADLTKAIFKTLFEPMLLDISFMDPREPLPEGEST